MVNLWDNASDVVADFGLLEQTNLALNSHTNFVDPNDLGMAQMNIEQIVQQIMTNNPGIAGQDLLGEVEKNLPNVNIPRDMVAQLVEQAELKNRDLEDHMNMNADGSRSTPEENILAGGSLLTAGTSLGYAGANGAMANEPEQRNNNNPFGFLAELMAMIEGIGTMLSSLMEQSGINTASQEQGVDIPDGTLVSPMQTPSALAQGRGQGLGGIG